MSTHKDDTKEYILDVEEAVSQMISLAQDEQTTRGLRDLRQKLRELILDIDNAAFEIDSLNDEPM